MGAVDNNRSRLTKGRLLLGAARLLLIPLLTGKGSEVDAQSEVARLVKDINPAQLPSSAASAPREIVQVGGIAFFSAIDESNGTELWKTDGTSEGTVLVKDIAPGPAHSFPSELTELNGEVYFTLSIPDRSAGYRAELWKSDGTAAGTILVKRISGDPGTYPLRELTVLGDKLLFVADDGSTGDELWRSDGTANGTELVADIHARAASSSPAYLTEFQGE